MRRRIEVFQGFVNTSFFFLHSLFSSLSLLNANCIIALELQKPKKIETTDYTDYTDYTDFYFLFLFFLIFPSSQLPIFPLLVCLCVTLWLKIKKLKWRSDKITNRSQSPMTKHPCNHAAMQPCSHAAMQPCIHLPIPPSSLCERSEQNRSKPWTRSF
jgi:hypothetical protein